MHLIVHPCIETIALLQNHGYRQAALQSYYQQLICHLPGSILIDRQNLDILFQLLRRSWVFHHRSVTNVSGRLQAIQFWYGSGNTGVGYISTTSSSTAYNTSSDYRLKENIAPMTGALDKVLTLKPVTYKWKIDGSNGEGFIAHELAEVVPDCVTGEKDAVETIDEFDSEGKVIGIKEVPKYQGVDTSFLVATLTAAIQELNAKVIALEAKVGA